MDEEKPYEPIRLGPLIPWISLAIAGLIVMVIAAFHERRPVEQIGPHHPAVGKKLTQLAIVPLTGDPPPLTVEDLPGRVTLINYWGTWCGPCVQEFPHLMDLEQKYHNRDDFRFVSVSSPNFSPDRAELEELTKQFLKSRGSDLPTYAEQDLAVEPRAFEAAGLLNGFPTTIILDKQGIIRGVWQGYEPGYELQMADLVKNLLAPETEKKN